MRATLATLMLAWALGCGGGSPAPADDGAAPPPDVPADLSPDPALLPDPAGPSDPGPADLPADPAAPDTAPADPGLFDPGHLDPGPSRDAPPADPGVPDAPADAPPDAASDAPADAAPDVPAPPPAGTLSDPLPAPRLPFVTSATTAGAPHAVLHAYDCAPSSPEGGPEWAWRVDLPAKGTLRVEVLEASGVDVDVHVLSPDAWSDGEGAVHGCRARANTALSLADQGPGPVLVVVDTYGAAPGTAPGAFTLAVEHEVLDAWQEVDVAPGVRWRQKAYADLLGGRQTVNVLEVRLADPAVTVRPWTGGGDCARPSVQGAKAGAVAALNGGFFDTSNCAALGLVQIDGTASSGNGVAKMEPHATLGITPDDRAVIDRCTGCASWPAMRDALGAYPNLVTDGAVDVDPHWAEALFDGRHPRTGVGVRSDGTLLLVTVDGRTGAGVGMTLADFAQYFLWLGARDAANLDGGGSTTLWVDGQSINGIVNFPSDDGLFDHWGERAVANGLLVVREGP